MQEALYRRANQFLKGCHYTEAILCFSICYLCGNRTQDCVGALSESLAITGHRRLAMQILQKYNKMYDLQFSIGWVYSLLGNHEEAIKIYEKLIEKTTSLSQPINYKLLANLIEEYRFSDRIQDALHLIQTYIEGKSLSDDCPAYLYYNVGCAFEQAQEHANALRYYDLAKEHGFDDITRLAHNIGISYIGLKDYPAALEQFTFALQLSSKADRAVELLAVGRTYKDMGDDNKARQYLIQSAKIGNKKAKEELASDTR